MTVNEVINVLCPMQSIKITDGDLAFEGTVQDFSNDDDVLFDDEEVAYLEAVNQVIYVEI